MGVVISSHSSSQGPLQGVTDRQGPLQSRCSTPERAFATATKQSMHCRRSSSGVVISSHSSSKGPLQNVTNKQGPLQDRCSTPRRAFTTVTKQSKQFKLQEIFLRLAARNHCFTSQHCQPALITQARALSGTGTCTDAHGQQTLTLICIWCVNVSTTLDTPA
ncbi:hypothetical protein ABBQ38_004306 [Trebouxia sp. C0009 RCD-2024]